MGSFMYKWYRQYTADIDRLHTLNLLQSLNCRFDKSVSRSPVFKLFQFGFTAHEDNLSHIEPGPIARPGVRPPGMQTVAKVARNNVVRLTDRLDMTIVVDCVDWDVKLQIKQTNIERSWW